MKRETRLAVGLALCAASALAFAQTLDAPARDTATPQKPRALDLYLSQNLVRIAQVRYNSRADAVAALQRNRIDSVRVLICPLTHREHVDKLVDALVAASIAVSQAKFVESREFMCADNARVETRTGT